MYDNFFITVNDSQGNKVRFYNAFLNGKGGIEFKSSTSDLFINNNIRVAYMNGKLFFNTKPVSTLPLERKVAKSVDRYKVKMLSDMKKLYQDVLNNKEKILIIRIPNTEHCLITTKRIYHKTQSSKLYNKILIKAFSNQVLRQEGCKGLDIENASDLQYKLNKLLKENNIKVEGIYETDYSFFKKMMEKEEFVA